MRKVIVMRSKKVCYKLYVSILRIVLALCIHVVLSIYDMWKKKVTVYRYAYGYGYGHNWRYVWVLYGLSYGCNKATYGP